MKRLLTVSEFLHNYAVSRTAAYNEIAAGRLKVTKLGRATRIAVEDAECWLANLRGEASNDNQPAS